MISVARGWENTKKATHADDSKINAYRTYAVTRGVNGTTAAVHASKALSRYEVPDDVKWLAKQIAALMKRKGNAGFAGKSGGGDMGEVFYYNEFPKTQMDRVQAYYKVW